MTTIKCVGADIAFLTIGQIALSYLTRALHCSSRETERRLQGALPANARTGLAKDATKRAAVSPLGDPAHAAHPTQARLIMAPPLSPVAWRGHARNRPGTPERWPPNIERRLCDAQPMRFGPGTP